MAQFVLVRHKVRNFTEWKKGFDAHQPKRAEARLIDRHVLQSADDPNNVYVLFEAEDMDRAKKFADSEDLKQTMQKAGVVDRPDIQFLKS